METADFEQQMQMSQGGIIKNGVLTDSTTNTI